MTKGLFAGVSSTWKVISAKFVGVGGAWKTVAAEYAGVGGVWKQTYPALDPLTANASPPSQTWGGSLGAYTGSVSVTPGGGSGNYTFAWEQDGGITPVNFDDAGAASTGVSSTVNNSASVRCLVGDDAGSTPVYSNSVSLDP